MIKDIINKRLGYIYHRTIKEIPFNKFIQKESEAENINDYNLDKNEKKFKVKDLVYIKNFNAHKLDAQFIGPYKVMKLGKKGRWLKTKNGTDWIHTKHAKLWKRGECKESNNNYLINLIKVYPRIFPPKETINMKENLRQHGK